MEAACLPHPVLTGEKASRVGAESCAKDIRGELAAPHPGERRVPLKALLHCNFEKNTWELACPEGISLTHGYGLSRMIRALRTATFNPETEIDC